jgi:hypothetical protein
MPFVQVYSNVIDDITLLARKFDPSSWDYDYILDVLVSQIAGADNRNYFPKRQVVTTHCDRTKTTTIRPPGSRSCLVCFLS